MASDPDETAGLDSYTNDFESETIKTDLVNSNSQFKKPIAKPAFEPEPIESGSDDSFYKDDFDEVTESN